MTIIHPTAIVGSNVKFGKDVVVGAYSIIGPNVVIGDNCYIASYVRIGSKMVLELPNSDEYGCVEIGNNTIINDYSLINVSADKHGITRIGSNVRIMTHCVIAHDCLVEDGVTIGIGCALAGHCKVLIGATLGLGVIVHQHTTIGGYAMIGLNASVVKDVYPLYKYIPGKKMTINKFPILRGKLILKDNWDEPYTPKEIENYIGWNHLFTTPEGKQLENAYSAIRNKTRDEYDIDYDEDHILESQVNS